ncbi:arabinose isomerase [bacterium]|nr:arabinose isomerase [bacterium]
MHVQRRTPLTARIGILAVGHRTYWTQFDGLRDELMRKYDALVQRVRTMRAEVVTFGMVDNAESAYAAVRDIKAADPDLLLIDMVTYATSSTFGVIAREIDAPIVLVALQPMNAMDYARGSTYMQLCNDDFCSVPEFTGVAVRMGRRPPEVILGTLHDDPAADAALNEWCRIAHVLHDLKRARIGHMGHVLEAMLDMHTDPAAVTAAFGCHIAQCEAEELLPHYRGAGMEAVAARKKDILAFFDTPDPVSDPLTSRLSDGDLDTAARAAVALDAFVAARNLDGLAYYYEGEAGSELRTVVTNLIVGNSLLCAAGFPMCGEYDLKTCIAMLIMDRLETGGSFAEFHPVDFARDSVLVGHDGPHHINIADGRPVLRSLAKYHGKPGAGASVEFRIKEGPITMLSIGVKRGGAFKFVIAEGESLRGPIPPTGNTNTHGRFPPDVRTFLTRWAAEGPTHHFALGIGHHARTIERIARCLGIEAVIVTNHKENA